MQEIIKTTVPDPALRKSKFLKYTSSTGKKGRVRKKYIASYGDKILVSNKGEEFDIAETTEEIDAQML